MKYSEKTLKYYENLKNIGSLDENLQNIGTGIVGSPLCGDVMKLQLEFDEKDSIKDAKYKVFGCVSAIASMELATTLLKGKTIEEAKAIKNADVSSELELSDIKKHCSVLAKEAIDAAIANYISKKNQTAAEMITLTNDAAEKLKTLLSNHDTKCIGINIKVSGNGCSGLDYSLSYATEIESNQKSTSTCGITFFYPADSESLIDGLQIELLENTFGHGFSVTNKNHISCQNCSCRCSK